jgi:hypothetical protein
MHQPLVVAMQMQFEFQSLPLITPDATQPWSKTTHQKRVEQKVTGGLDVELNQ